MNITDQKIKFYQRCEGSTWANKFQGDLTFGELLNNIANNQYPVVAHEEFSPPLNDMVKSNALIINDQKVAGVVLENGDTIRIQVASDTRLLATFELWPKHMDKKYMELLEGAAALPENRESI